MSITTTASPTFTLKSVAASNQLTRPRPRRTRPSVRHRGRCRDDPGRERCGLARPGVGIVSPKENTDLPASGNGGGITAALALEALVVAWLKGASACTTS